MTAASLSVIFSSKALRFYGFASLFLAVVFESVALALLGGLLIYYSRQEEKPIG
jgi:hypothetical protein